MTLGIYVIHEFPLKMLGKHGFDFLPFPEWTRWLMAIFWFLVCHCIVLGLRKFKFSRIAFFGDEKSISSLIKAVKTYVVSLVA